MTAMISDLPTLRSRREDAAVHLFQRMLQEDHPLHDLVPPTRSGATGRSLRNSGTISLPKARTKRLNNSLISLISQLETNDEPEYQNRCVRGDTNSFGGGRSMCQLSEFGPYPEFAIARDDKSDASNMRPRGTICCRGSFCHGEKVSRSNNGAKTPSAANRPSRPHITRVAQRKNNADAQQDCEGGYVKTISEGNSGLKNIATFGGIEVGNVATAEAR
ncbi:hypothetical protein Bbelb_059480 [Branchiostoma belcheri]|nr:hypothetical protein Bbelb_059480 [Branchiostoma belcheri]